MTMNKVDYKKEAKELLKLVLEVFIITFVITKFLFMPISVKGSSMYPNLKDGDFGFAGIANKIKGIERFDIVIICFDDSVKNPDNDNIVKRVIGLPGEYVEFIDSELYINGEYIDQPFIDDSVKTENLEVTLGEDEYFVLGDNREVSRDSRYYGPCSISEIKAKGVFKIINSKDNVIVNSLNIKGK